MGASDIVVTDVVEKRLEVAKSIGATQVYKVSNINAIFISLCYILCFVYIHIYTTIFCRNTFIE